jgi:hypothetical protein
MLAIARKTSFFYFTHLVTFCAPAWPALMKGKVESFHVGVLGSLVAQQFSPVE